MVNAESVSISAHFRAGLTIVISREELLGNPLAVAEAKRMAVTAISESPETYAVLPGNHTVRATTKDFPR
jgi:hypothetical protein